MAICAQMCVHIFEQNIDLTMSISYKNNQLLQFIEVFFMSRYILRVVELYPPTIDAYETEIEAL